MTILITSVLNPASDRLVISSSLSCIFCWIFKLFFHLGLFFWSRCASYVVRGGALGITRAGYPTWLCYGAVCGGRVKEGTVPLAWLLASFQSLLCYPQANWALMVLIPMWVGICSRTLWVSPVNYPVRLGVSPTTAIPHRFFSQRF